MDFCTFMTLLIYFILCWNIALIQCSIQNDCSRHLRFDDDILVGSVCSPTYPKYLNCLIHNINSSNHVDDLQFKYSINLTRIIKKTKLFCKKYKKLRFHKADCDINKIPVDNLPDTTFCKSRFPRYAFLKLNRCPLRVRIFWFTYLDSILSNKCKIIDPLFHLIPNYGPELKCYPVITSGKNPLKVYRKFCSKYNHTKTDKCIDDVFKNITSLTKNNKAYISKVKNFADTSNLFCQKLQHIKRNVNGNESACDKIVFEKKTDNILELIKIYSECVGINQELSILIANKLTSFHWDIKHAEVFSRGSNRNYNRYIFVSFFMPLILIFY